MTATRDENYPYTLEVIPPGENGKGFQWAIRRHGKMHQRSDRHLPNENKARNDGLEVIQRILSKQDAW